MTKPTHCQGCNTPGWLTRSPSWSKWLCAHCLPVDERPPSWPNRPGNPCKLREVEYDGARYCGEHFGFAAAGTGSCHLRDEVQS